MEAHILELQHTKSMLLESEEKNKILSAQLSKTKEDKPNQPMDNHNLPMPSTMTKSWMNSSKKNRTRCKYDHKSKV
eukprot:TRINITY_DN728_c0_g1_i1.p1 TRINITY_DN728_c0_g1~~TRINITY_DN728_c0_g1_i1.p1  ORF type:complete len:76 (-),score=8.09 TRINITY_DN728_c0_g1_i1:22-249(-)